MHPCIHTHAHTHTHIHNEPDPKFLFSLQPKLGKTQLCSCTKADKHLLWMDNKKKQDAGQKEWRLIDVVYPLVDGKLSATLRLFAKWSLDLDINAQEQNISDHLWSNYNEHLKSRGKRPLLLLYNIIWSRAFWFLRSKTVYLKGKDSVI